MELTGTVLLAERDDLISIGLRGTRFVGAIADAVAEVGLSAVAGDVARRAAK